MTPEQFDRWRDFSTRFARHAGRYSKASRAEALAGVVEILAEFGGAAADVDSWDDGVGDACRHYLDAIAPRSVRLSEAAWTRWERNGWRSFMKCAVRAGIDMASEPSGGVVGFCVGDLREMYPEGLPPWLTDGFVAHDGQPVDLNAADATEAVWL